MTHTHTEVIDKHGVGRCPCGREQLYDSRNPNTPPTLLKAGASDYVDPDKPAGDTPAPTKQAVIASIVRERKTAPADYLPTPDEVAEIAKPHNGLWFHKFHFINTKRILDCCQLKGFHDTKRIWRYSTRGLILFLEAYSRADLIPAKTLALSERHKGKHPQKGGVPGPETGQDKTVILAGGSGSVTLTLKVDLLKMSCSQRRWLVSLLDIFISSPGEIAHHDDHN